MVAKTLSSINKIILSLYNDGNINKSALANLRASNSINSKHMTEVWSIFFKYIAKEDLSQNYKPSYTEIAVFTAVKCFAIYQQGSTECTYGKSYGDNAKGLTFFNALANLRKDAEEKEALDRRVQALLATSNVESVINGIIHTLQILKSHNKHLVIDFAKLGQDLYHFQFDSYSARETCLKWGEEYFAADANLKK